MILVQKLKTDTERFNARGTVHYRGAAAITGNPYRSRELLPLSSRDKTLHLTPRATESGYDHTQTKSLARTLACTF
jgi:hypothetical protein